MEAGILIIVGILSGISIHRFFPYFAKGGILGDLLLGILGALEGGLGSNILYLQSRSFNYSSIFLGLAGAFTLLCLQRFLAKTDKTASLYSQDKILSLGGEQA